MRMRASCGMPNADETPIDRTATFAVGSEDAPRATKGRDTRKTARAPRR